MKLEDFMKKIEHESSAIEILRLKNQYFTEKSESKPKRTKAVLVELKKKKEDEE